ncbi:hypothetical protein NW762_008894 [Fusarium torreyae]|uniref:Uncharacterized protein n=1 Tax=Fusarium torreyae TaxID=1237075 RepID=A0A9W8RYB1_9HYPO|nr:hypothetical protein NW762_008894 [Fusarium torreyae]
MSRVRSPRRPFRRRKSRHKLDINWPRRGRQSESNATPSQPGHRRQLIATKPRSSGAIRILKRVIVSPTPEGGFAMSSPRETGPETDFCARVPGRPNTWVARVSSIDALDALIDLVKDAKFWISSYCCITQLFEEANNLSANGSGIPKSIVVWTGLPDLYPEQSDEQPHRRSDEQSDEQSDELADDLLDKESDEQVDEPFWPILLTVLGEEGCKALVQTMATS